MKLRYINANRDAGRTQQLDAFRDMVFAIINEFNDFYRSAEKSRRAKIDSDYEKEKSAYDAEQEKDREDYAAARKRGDYTDHLPAGSRLNRGLRKVSDYLKSPSKRRTPRSSAATAASVDSRMGDLNEETSHSKNKIILEEHRKNKKVHPVTKNNWWFDA